MQNTLRKFCVPLNCFVYKINTIVHESLLHLGLISSNRIAWNASRDCPSQSIVYPLRLLGAMAAVASHSNKTAWHLTSRFVRYLSSSHTIRMIYQISYTSLIIWTNYLPIIGILSFIYTLHNNARCYARRLRKSIFSSLQYLSLWIQKSNESSF